MARTRDQGFAAGCREEDLSGASDLTVAGRVLIHYFTAAVQGGDLGLQYLDYRDLTPAVLPSILDVFRTQLSAQAMAATRHVFRLDSKVDFRADSFDMESRRAQKRHAVESIEVAPALQSLYERLKAANGEQVKNRGHVSRGTPKDIYTEY